MQQYARVFSGSSAIHYPIRHPSGSTRPSIRTNNFQRLPEKIKRPSVDYNSSAVYAVIPCYRTDTKHGVFLTNWPCERTGRFSMTRERGKMEDKKVQRKQGAIGTKLLFRKQKLRRGEVGLKGSRRSASLCFVSERKWIVVNFVKGRLIDIRR